MLLHGLGATARLNWGPCFRPLSRHFRVLALDHRGHGGGLRTRRFSLEVCAHDAAAAARALEVKRFVAVGYSMGGPIAMLSWRRHADQVAGLVLCATARHFAAPNFVRMAGMALPLAARLARLAPERTRMRMMDRMLSRIEHPELRRRVLEELAGHDPAAVLQATHAVTRFSSHDWISEVDVPTAVVITTRDELVPPSRQRKLAASIRGARVYEVDGDHSACVAAADAFAPTLVRACRDVARHADFGTG